MGFFSNLKRSAQKSKLIKSAAQRVQSGDLAGAVEEIYSYLQSDETFSQIITHFGATQIDIKAIIGRLMASGAGGTYKGHFVPVSAVLFPDTLAYLLRSERGQITKKDAYFQVLDYFQSGAIAFAPERAFH